MDIYFAMQGGMEIADQLHKDGSGAAGWHGGSGVMGDAQHRAPGWALVGVTCLFFERGREKTDLGMSSCACSGKKTLVFPWLGAGA